VLSVVAIPVPQGVALSVSKGRRGWVLLAPLTCRRSWSYGIDRGRSAPFHITRVAIRTASPRPSPEPSRSRGKANSGGPSGPFPVRRTDLHHHRRPARPTRSERDSTQGSNLPRVSLEQVDRPIPGQEEVLVNIHATTVDRLDCHTREANRRSGLAVTLLSRSVSACVGRGSGSWTASSQERSKQSARPSPNSQSVTTSSAAAGSDSVNTC